MDTCAICIIPCDSIVPLDGEGVCSICRNYDSLRIRRKENLDKLLCAIRAARGPRGYDCVAAFSGGRDSTYMLYNLTRLHGLKCVAVFGRTFFTPPEILDSARRTCRFLGVPLIEIDLGKTYSREFCRKMIRSWLRKKHPLFASLACCPCKLVNRDIFRAARKYRVRFIAYGGNRLEHFHAGACDTSPGDGERFSRQHMVRDMLRTVMKGTALTFENPELLRHLSLLVQASILYRNQYTPYLRLRYPGLRAFDYFHYAEWNESELERILHDVGWRMPSSSVTSWRADCELEELKNLMYHHDLGMNHVDAFYSNMIREDAISRDEALKRRERESFSPARFRHVLRILEFDESEFHFLLDDRARAAMESSAEASEDMD